MITALRQAGGHPTYFEYPGCGHNSWDSAYATDWLYHWLDCSTVSVVTDRCQPPSGTIAEVSVSHTEEFP